MGELKDIMAVAREFGFFVVCDEIYAEFDRSVVPTIFSVDSEYGIVTTSFTKAFGLGGLKLGVALAQGMLVNELYVDVLNTVGNSPNVVQLLASEILKNGMEALERHKRRWRPVKRETEQRLDRQGIEYFPNKLSVNYWAKLPVKDTCRWIDEHAVPKNDVAPLPGAFFLFKSGCEIVQSNMVRIGLGHVNPEGSDLPEALEAMEKALETYCSAV
jgi:aminotransferase